MDNKIKVFITGGSGYLAVSIANILKKNFYITLATRFPKKINLKDKNIKIIKTFYKKEDLLRKTKNYNTIIHLIGFANKQAANNKKESLRLKSRSTKNILYICKKNNIKNLIYISSSKVYQNFDKINVISENQKKETKNIYSLSHLQAEKIISNNLTFKLNTKILRLSNVFGLSIYHNSEEALNNLINNFCYQGIYNNSIIVKKPNVVRNFFPLILLAKIIYSIIKNKEKKLLTITNLGYKSFTLYKLAYLVKKLIKKVLNKDIKLILNERLIDRKVALYKSSYYNYKYSKKLFCNEIKKLLIILIKNEKKNK